MGNHDDPRFTPSDAEVIRHKVRKLIGKYGWTASDEPDLQQELSMHVWMRAARHDPGRAARSTFVDRITSNKIANIIEGRLAIKRGGGRTLQPLEDESEGVLLDVDHDASELDRQIDVREALGGLPPELRVVAERLTVESPAEAARSLNLTRQQMRTRMAAIEKRLRAGGFDEDF